MIDFFRNLYLAFTILCLLSSAGLAQQPVPTLEKKVRGVLEAHCYRCHSHQAGKSKGDLMVDSRNLLLRGGDSGPAIVPGHPEKSLLIKAILHVDENLKMPQKGKLAADEIALLTEWVKAGAPWTETPSKAGLRLPGKITSEDRNYWAFQPVKAGEPPNVDESNPIDRFILARLRQEGLKPAPAAEPGALIRRLYFDVIGLAPSPEDVDEFVQDHRINPEAAITKLIDHLLASPHYGERWARHWLDVVRFAESDGYRLDSFRPHAWRYRDYVIKSFNDDKPYDRFVREQIAGDELYPDDPTGLVAIGFLTHGIYEFNQRDVRGQWHETMSELTDVTGEVFLGLSVGCARCHDHKFDPILQTDYYSLRSFFEGLMPSVDVQLATTAQKAEYARQLAVWEAKTARIRRQIEAIEGPHRASTAAGATSKFQPEFQAMLKKPFAERTPLEKQLAALAYRQLTFEYVSLDNRIKGEEKDRLLALRRELARFDDDKPALLLLCQSLQEVGPVPPPTVIPKKANASPIGLGFLSVLGDPAATVVPPTHQATSGRRAALAQWLTRQNHPLTSRVMVNRIWQQHFGQGLVATASDFGNLGEKPSHPELLDWLTQRFVQDGWSVKKLHRLILTSKTYQQSALSAPDADALKKDPGNRLLWRMPTRRLDAEQIRDAMLAVTGKLDSRIGGPSAELREPRRSIYLKTLRNTKEPLLEAFDVPDGFGSTGRRNVTTTSTQALLMFNSSMMLQRSSAFAEALHKVPATDEQRIERAFRLALGRAPSSKETSTVLGFLTQQAQRVAPRDKAPEYETAKIPFHEGKAAVVTPGGVQARFQIPDHAKLPGERFTVEAFVVLRSVFDDDSVRTIASHWNGDQTGSGWALGVTGKKSAYKAQMLLLQLWGRTGTNQPAHDIVFTGLHLQLNRPYFVAVSVDLKDTSEQGIVFYVKDLANEEEGLDVYTTTHKVVSFLGPRGNFTIGGTVGKDERSWDGLIDDVRLSNAILNHKQLLFVSGGVTKETVGFWQFEATPGMLQDSSPNRLTLERRASATAPAAVPLVEPRRAAWIDFCQVLLNANEFLYVD